MKDNPGASSVAATPTQPGPSVDFSRTETVGSTRWLRLETLTYEVPPPPSTDAAAAASTDDVAPVLRKWDRAVRTTKLSETSTDAAMIFAVLRGSSDGDGKGDMVVCVKQYRPPIDAHCVELPAGLIDPNEDTGTAAAREFLEETGYVGTVDSIGPTCYLSPGLSNESACLVRLNVDMSLDVNRENHERKGPSGAEDGEIERGLEVVLLPRIGFLEALLELREREGVRIFAALHSLAVGMAMADGASEGAG